MIVGYARISTDQQQMGLQLDALRAANCEKVFSDVMSGGKVDRPELNKCLAFLQKGDTLVCWKLDRLGRDLRHLVNVVHDLTDRGVGFRVLTGQGAAIDTTTAPGKLVFGIFAALAEFERALIKERVNAGIAAAKARGVQFGRRPILTSDMLDQVRDLSIRDAAKQLGVSKSAVHKHRRPS